MKKLILTAAAILACLLLSGCVHVDIDARLSDTNEVSLTYDITVDGEAVAEEDADSAKDALEQLSRHFTRMGYDVTAEDWSVRAVYSEQCSSPEEAAAAFAALMTSEYYSPFTQAGLSYDIGGESAYRFTGTIDAAQIIDAQGLRDIPEAVVPRGALPQGAIGTVTVSLPGADGSGTATVELNADGRTQIDVSSVFTADAGERAAAERTADFAGVLFVAGGAVTLLLIILLIVSLTRRARRDAK